MFAREVAQLQDAKAVEIEEARERVRKKSKMEMETLRWTGHSTKYFYPRYKIFSAIGPGSR